MKKLSMISCLLLLPILMMAQQPISFSVSISSSDTIHLNDLIEIRYKIEGAEYSDFQLPEFEGFEIVSGPYQSTSIEYINGRMSRETSYTYRLMAIAGGSFTFPPASIVVGDETMKTEPVKITVINDGSTNPRPQTRPYDRKPKKNNKDNPIYSI